VRLQQGRVELDTDLSENGEWKYVQLRRTVVYLEHSIGEGIQWAVFEPSCEPTWERLRGEISSLLECAWRKGSLRGGDAGQAFFVRCDRSTMSQEDIDEGRIVALAGMALLRPAEFAIIRIRVATAPACRVPP
jgi:phage tail sheath protein FI